MFKNLDKKIITACKIALFLLIFFTLSVILEYGVMFRNFHPYFEYGFYGVMCALFICYLLIPLIKLFRMPSYEPPPSANDQAACLKYRIKRCAQLAKSNFLKTTHPNLANKLNAVKYNFTLNLEALNEANKVLDEEAKKLVKSTALKVAAGTAVSQNSIIDFFIVLINNINLIHKIAGLYYSRPEYGRIIKLYTLAGGAAFLSEQVEDMDLSQEIEGLLSSLGISSAIPGLGKIIESALQGAMNGIITLKIGFMVKNACSANTKEALDSAKADGQKDTKENLVGFFKEFSSKLVKRGFKSIVSGIGTFIEKYLVNFGNGGRAELKDE